MSVDGNLSSERFRDYKNVANFRSIRSKNKQQNKVGIQKPKIGKLNTLEYQTIWSLVFKWFGLQMVQYSNGQSMGYVLLDQPFLYMKLCENY